MPTILTHPAVPIALYMGLGQKKISKQLLIAGCIASVLPDLDVVAFSLGVPYAAEFGHRGFSHSLVFALLIAIAGALLASKLLESIPTRAFWFIFVAAASHGLLDAFTNGGLGIAFLWPLTDQRFFAPFHPIEVAPLGLSRFLSERGVTVLWSEVLWVWLPLLCMAAVFATARTRKA
ncbi:MAG TPA: metal-dependent hydrolase [Gallionellaceae bacterium]